MVAFLSTYWTKLASPSVAWTKVVLHERGCGRIVFASSITESAFLPGYDCILYAAYRTSSVVLVRRVAIIVAVLIGNLGACVRSLHLLYHHCFSLWNTKPLSNCNLDDFNEPAYCSKLWMAFLFSIYIIKCFFYVFSKIRRRCIDKLFFQSGKGSMGDGTITYLSHVLFCMNAMLAMWS